MFKVFWLTSKAYFAAIVLPFGSFADIFMSGSLESSGLLKTLPACYSTDEARRGVMQWSNGFEAGGSEFGEREYPLVFLEQNISIPLEGEFEITLGSAYRWIKIAELEDYDNGIGVNLDHIAKAFEMRLNYQRSLKSQQRISSTRAETNADAGMLPVQEYI
jgi:hypothetical protein